ncbi:MAG: hypothetical protein AB8B86_17550 [Pseudomonadales bacterium]
MSFPSLGIINMAGTTLLIFLAACAPHQSFKSTSTTDVRAVLEVDNRKFDPRDLSGIWTRGHPDGGTGGPESCINAMTHTGPCGDRGFSTEFPSFTPEGQKAFDANKPSYGRRLGSNDAAAHPEEHIGRRRAIQQGVGNDPQGTCNPIGVARAILFPQEQEMLMTDDRILHHFSYMNAWRSIWTDGRQLPDIDDIASPLWYGYSAGKWNGDTLVVETIGQDDRIWLDQYGYPISEEARLVERYRRISYSTLELNMTLVDPKYYTKPWVGQTKRFLWRPKDYFANSNWPGMYYDDCAPIDEVDSFKSLIVDPSAASVESR